jgi:hypothetical protein
LERGRAIAVSCRLPTEAAWVQAQVRSCGICGRQSGARTGFLPVLRFPLLILIPPTAPHSSSGTIGKLVADVPTGLSLTPFGSVLFDTEEHVLRWKFNTEITDLGLLKLHTT